jgi:penicillin amidase
MRAATSLFFVITGALIGCGDDGRGPYDDLPIDERIDGTGVTAPVDVVRDEYGVPHLHASRIGDLAFAQGYVMAADRIQQMDLFRHVGAGRLAELFGALDPGQIDGDLFMRIHRFEAIAQATWDDLQASSDPDDAELVTYLERFSDGVNRFLDDVEAGTREIDPALLTFFDPARTAPWTPVDSLVIGRLQALSLSFSDAELRDTEMRQRALAFDTAPAGTDLGRRAGAYQDLVPVVPADPTSTRDGFPTDEPIGARPPNPRPPVPLELLRRVQVPRIPLLDGEPGSNNWAVGPDLAGGGTLLANDPHLGLSSPSIFYAMHLTVDGDVDVAGITFPGVPGIILGHNQHLAWGATVVGHDVADFYLEAIAPCPAGGGDCTSFEGGAVPIESWNETIQIGALGTITETRTVTYERVPHHGPILPIVVDHDVVPRPAGPAISVRYTGHERTNELAAFQGLWRARTVDEAILAMRSFGFGGQNWMLADDSGRIGWTTHALVPWRTDGCFSWDPATGAGVAPWWIVPGDGSCEWDGWIDARYIPHARDPARGFLVTANADPVGSTFDGDPTNTSAEGKVLYVGARYDEGFRAGRITRRLAALADGGDALTVDDMTAIQGDAYSNVGAKLTPAILAALDDLDSVAGELTPDQLDRIDQAPGLLEAWRYDTPADGADSAAAVVFNVWLVEFLARAFGDEAEVLGRAPGDWLTNGVVAVLTRPGDLRTGLAAETGEPILCDDLATPGPTIESCTLEIALALDAAIAWIRDESGLGADPAGWRWGDLHRVTLEPLIPLGALVIDDGGEGFRRHGDNHVVDASNPGMEDLDFTFDSGPAMRHVTAFAGDQPRTLIALPGGEVLDTRSSHFRDLMDSYWSVNAYFELPWTVDQVIDHHETRWRFER